jgi:hypothetical protein
MSDALTLDLSALLFHAALEEQFPDVMNYAAHNQRSAADVQDLLWTLAVTPSADPIVPSNDDLAPLAQNPALRRFMNRVIEGDLREDGESGRGWSGVAFVGSVAAFRQRLRDTRVGRNLCNPFSWRDRLIKPMSTYIGNIEETLEDAGRRKTGNVTLEHDRRKLIAQLIEFDPAKGKGTSAIEKLVKNLLQKGEGQGIEILEDPIDYAIEIAEGDEPDAPAPDEWVVVMARSIHRGLSLTLAGRRIEINDPEAPWRDSAPETELLNEVLELLSRAWFEKTSGASQNDDRSAPCMGQKTVERASCFLNGHHSTLSALDLETLCSVVEFALVLDTSSESKLDGWGAALEAYRRHVDFEDHEHRAHLIRHFSFVSGWLRRSNEKRLQEDGKAQRNERENWEKLARDELDRYRTALGHVYRERREVAVDYYTALHRAYTESDGQDPGEWFKIASRAQSFGMTEMATAAGALGAALVSHTGAGPNESQADRAAALFDPFVVVGLRKKIWSIQSLRLGPTKERDRVFLSYRRADSFSIVQGIKGASGAEERGSQYWLDVAELQRDREEGQPIAVGSKDWRLGLLGALYDCDRVVICFSPGYFRSQACLNELRSAALASVSRSIRLTWLAVDGAAFGLGEERYGARARDVDAMRNLVRAWARLGGREVEMESVETVLKTAPAVRHLLSPFLQSDVETAGKNVWVWKTYGLSAFD